MKIATKKTAIPKSSGLSRRGLSRGDFHVSNLIDGLGRVALRLMVPVGLTITGETQSPAAKAPGTIPGSRSLPHSDFLGQRNQAWYLNEGEITARVNQAELDPSARTTAFCNTGHWAATDWFVLSELAGFEEVALYDGSMAEWSQDSDRPPQVAKKGLGKILDFFN